jgi:DNA-binding transcriptional MerR regulator
MAYSIGAAARIMGVAPSTLRYYDKEGLLPRVERNAGGLRVFSEQDMGTLRMIECLKRTGLSIKDIRRFMQWCEQGDDTIEQRLQMFHERKAAVEEQMRALQATMDMIEYKCWYYETAENAGTEATLHDMPLEDMPPRIQELRRTYYPQTLPHKEGEGAA